jgi:hypothetical protein
MSRELRQRAKRHGTASIFAGDEPQWHELTEHWPKPKIKRRRFPPLPKRMAKLKRKDRATKRAAVASYQASLTSPWPIYVKGGPNN